MNAGDLYQTAETQYKLSNVLLGVLLIGLLVLGLYILWKWCGDEDKDKERRKDLMTMQPVFAHEIEPGLVVIQSEDGEYFRILREYESAKTNQYGALTRSEMTSPKATTAQIHGRIMTSPPTGYAASPFPHGAYGTGSLPSAPPALSLQGEEIVEYERQRVPPPYTQ